MERISEIARARLAYITAGQRPLGVARRAIDGVEAGDDTEVAEVGVAAPDSTGGARRPITRSHVVVLVLLLVVAIGVGAFAFVRGQAVELPLDPVSEAAPQVSASAAATPEAKVSGPAQLRVHVAGAVVRPGVVRVAPGAIVQDAIAAAGGLAKGADPADLNLAAPVTDGMQIRIGTVEEPTGTITEQTANPAGSSSEKAQLDLNEATQAELEALPGVGPVMAAAIIAWRDEHGRFGSVDELQEISGVGPKTFQKLEPLVRT